MYFSWQEMPFIPPRNLREAQAEVAIIGAGPVGLATALGLARHGVSCVVLEQRKTISEGSRALAMTRRSMQILDQLGVGAKVLEKALRWSEGWTFYGNHLVHSMNLAMPPNEKHGQTNLQQCWMEQLLLDELQRYPHARVMYQYTVTGLEQARDGVTLALTTPGGDLQFKCGYAVAADGPRGTTRKQVGIEYEGTSYSQRFVINDIICRESLPPGRRLFFSPPYLPGKTVLMHKAPFDMWRLDFQLLDDQDAQEEMLPERVHKRIRAHFELMGIAPNYELVLTSVYRANALSLPTYNSGRVLFAGDAAHQVPIFGGRGVNHGYEDAFNLAWKLADVCRGRAAPALLNTYTQERRGAILDTLAELTRTTIFITTPSAGMALVREAVLSLSVEENFLANLFDPYASAPYEYADSALNATAPASEDFGPRCGVGALAPDVDLGGGQGRLYDRFGIGFTLLHFLADNDAASLARDWQQSLALRGHAVQVIAVAIASEASQAAAGLYGARTGTTYILRPDNRIAGRWRGASLQVLDQALRRARLAQTADPVPANDGETR
jgi:3-(3-hydroxy-phenyl)propionate hydroxylase